MEAKNIFSVAGVLRRDREREYPTACPPEVHQVFAGGDWEVRPGFRINLGCGFDVGGNGPGVVLKSRFQWDWDLRRSH